VNVPLARLRDHSDVVAVLIEGPGGRLGPQRVEDPTESGFEIPPSHRGEDFDPPAEVAGTPIGRSNKIVVGSGVLEVKDPLVLEEAAQDAPDSNSFAEPGNAGTQGTQAPDDEVDLDSGDRRPIEGTDHLGILESVARPRRGESPARTA
jgi:hypothetical protein